jgi:hypothetical protein
MIDNFHYSGSLVMESDRCPQFCIEWSSLWHRHYILYNWLIDLGLTLSVYNFTSSTDYSLWSYTPVGCCISFFFLACCPFTCIDNVVWCIYQSFRILGLLQAFGIWSIPGFHFTETTTVISFLFVEVTLFYLIAIMLHVVRADCVPFLCSCFAVSRKPTVLGPASWRM